MNKQDLVSRIAETENLSRSVSIKVVDVIFAAITKALKSKKESRIYAGLIALLG
ncbi:MAG: HU family DNA-binding protein [Pseudomonadota bacterium]